MASAQDFDERLHYYLVPRHLAATASVASACLCDTEEYVGRSAVTQQRGVVAAVTEDLFECCTEVYRQNKKTLVYCVVCSAY